MVVDGYDARLNMVVRQSLFHGEGYMNGGWLKFLSEQCQGGLLLRFGFLWSIRVVSKEENCWSGVIRFGRNRRSLG